MSENLGSFRVELEKARRNTVLLRVAGGSGGEKTHNRAGNGGLASENPPTPGMFPHPFLQLAPT